MIHENSTVITAYQQELFKRVNLSDSAHLSRSTYMYTHNNLYTCIYNTLEFFFKFWTPQMHYICKDLCTMNKLVITEMVVRIMNTQECIDRKPCKGSTY